MIAVYKKESKRVGQIGINNLIKELDYIAPTPFKLDDEKINTSIDVNISDKGKEYKATCIKEKLKLHEYYIVIKNYNKLVYDWYIKCPASILLSTYIGDNLKINSNYVEIKEEEFCLNSKCSRRTFYNAINVLLRPAIPNTVFGDSNALLAATNKRGIYIVNHNLMFRGDYDKLVNYIIRKYPNGCNLDEKGRVILK